MSSSWVDYVQTVKGSIFTILANALINVLHKPFLMDTLVSNVQNVKSGMEPIVLTDAMQVKFGFMEIVFVLKILNGMDSAA